MLFDAKVSKTDNTVLVLLGWLPGARKPSPLLATLRSIQHARRLCVGVAPSVLWILQGPLSQPSSTVPCPLGGLCFLVFNPGTLLFWTEVVFRAGLSQNLVSVFQALSIAHYFCTMVARSVKRVTSRRLMAFMIPLSVQLLQKIEIVLSSQQSFILFITRRNLAQ